MGFENCCEVAFVVLNYYRIEIGNLVIALAGVGGSNDIHKLSHAGDLNSVGMATKEGDKSAADKQCVGHVVDLFLLMRVLGPRGGYSVFPSVMVPYVPLVKKKGFRFYPTE